MAPASPSLVHPRYETLGLVGRGSQGVVLRVRDLDDPTRPLVAKLFDGEAVDEGAIRDEFAVLARLAVDGIARVRDLARDARTGKPFLVEDYVSAGVASDWVLCAPVGPARGTRVVRLLREATLVLAALEDAGVVHGDVKPAHLRMDAQGFTLLDLGAALAPALGIDRGGFSPAFAAPEILAGGAATARSDLFGLGAAIRAILAFSPGDRARAAAPWLSPRVAALLDELVAPAADDRPASALRVLARLGQSAPGGGLPATTGRDAELAALAAPFDAGPRVRCLVGPPASGKSHVLDAVHKSLLLAGEDARLLRFPEATTEAVERALGWLSASGRGVLLIDELSRAPRALRDAVARLVWDRAGSGPSVIATNAEALRGSLEVRLGPLSPEVSLSLARRLGARDDEEAQALVAEAAGRPGWLVAAAARVPLSWDAVRARAEDLADADAVAALSAIACAGGSLSLAVLGSLVPTASIKTLVAAALVRVRGDVAGLVSPALASTIAAALADETMHERLGRALLADATATGPQCLACGVAFDRATSRGAGGTLRRDLLRAAVSLAARTGDAETEIAAGLALMADIAERTPKLLARLERKTRDEHGAPRAELLSRLDEGAAGDPRLVPLAKRRRADEAAKAGRAAEATTLAEEATTAARALGDRWEEALGLAMQGAVALLLADWTNAEVHLAAAEICFGEGDADDPEERARLSHNRGAIALFRGDVPAAIVAFEDALARKRRIHDRAGMRACLSNLALAEVHRGNYQRADELLDAAIALAKELGQTTGLSWCLGARAHAALARRRFDEARDHAEEALAVEAIPAGLRADLVLHRADALGGVGRIAEAWRALAEVSPSLRAEDPWLEARASLVDGRLCLLADRDASRLAGRRAIHALRIARRGAHADLEAEASQLLRTARKAMLSRVNGAWGRDDDDALDELLSALSRGTSRDELGRALLAGLIQALGGERAFLVQAAADAELVQGVDLDGLPLAESAARLDRAFLQRLRAAAPGELAREPIDRAGARLGLRVTSARGDVALVVEHRFSTALLALEPVAAVARRLHRWCLLGVMVNQAEQSPTVPPETAAGPGLPLPIPTPPRIAPSRTPRTPHDLEATVLPARRSPARVFPELRGTSPAFRAALDQLSTAVDSDLPVLLLGETGTGKELFARALHDHGRRKAAPFVAVSCAAIADALFEGELFGHARGSFTGADRARPGLLARAEGGTLFLDEIGELPLLRQATLLRVLETRRFRPVGSDEERAFDLRLVAATNRDLDAAVASGSFRADLLYRLRVLSILVPPLRDRAGDIAALFAHQAAAVQTTGGVSPTLSPAALEVLSGYSFPGNVRELRHLVERLSASGVTRVEPVHLPRSIRSESVEASRVRPAPGPAPKAEEPADEPAETRAEIERALATTGGNITHAAAALGLTRHGLKKRMARVGLRTARKDDE